MRLGIGTITFQTKINLAIHPRENPFFWGRVEVPVSITMKTICQNGDLAPEVGFEPTT